MPRDDASHSESDSASADVWDDAGILLAVQERSQALLESLLAQRRDLEMQGSVVAVDNQAVLQSALDRAIASVRQTLEAAAESMRGLRTTPEELER